MVNNEENSSNNTEAASSTKQQLSHQTSSTPTISDEEMHVNKLRQLLGAGQKTDAIDLAIKHNMWPHALFLASSFNNSALGNTQSITATPASSSAQPAPVITSAAAAAAAQLQLQQQQTEPKLLHKVKIRFINSLQPNDPIQTCYQLLIGRVPTIASVFYTHLFLF